MKMMPTRYGTTAPISNEELKVVNKLKSCDCTDSSKLSSRDIALADRLVARGIVDKDTKNKKTFYMMTKGGTL